MASYEVGAPPSHPADSTPLSETFTLSNGDTDSSRSGGADVKATDDDGPSIH